MGVCKGRGGVQETIDSLHIVYTSMNELPFNPEPKTIVGNHLTALMRCKAKVIY